MTLVDQTTGEVIEPLNERDARELTERIKSSAEGLFDLAVEAYHRQVWIALGYESWDDYLTGELGNVRLKLPREDRAEQVASLRERGLSLRAIASVTGSDKNTVMNDLRQVSETHTPDPKPVTGRDGKTYTRKPKPSQPKPKPPVDVEAERLAAAKQARLSRLYSALEHVGRMPAVPAVVVTEIPDNQSFRIDEFIDDACEWLTEFRMEWKKRHGANQ